MELQGKVALGTGSSRRVGKAIALALAGAGADLVLHYRTSTDNAQAVAGQIAQLGRRGETMRADLARPDEIAAMFDLIKDRFGRLDVLVNSAAVYHRTPLASLTAEQWDDELTVNARAAALCIRHAAALMDKDGGAIVNIADIAPQIGWADYPAYCASKGALLALTRSAAKALAPKITVNAVSPGIIALASNEPDRNEQQFLDRVPMKHIGRPEDVAAAVLFLVQQSYITGQNLRVDGGRCMS